MSQLGEPIVGTITSEGPTGLSRIYRPDVGLAVWSRRQPLNLSSAWLDEVTSTQWSIRERVDSSLSRASQIFAHLPPGDSRAAFVEDLQLLVGMFSDLTGAAELGLRIESISHNVCSAWHVDRVSLRLITTYVGPGTEWLPTSDVWCGTTRLTDHAPWFVISPWASVQRVRPFDVGVFKGTPWEPPHHPIVHRSPHVPEGQRLLVTIDPL